MLRFKGMTFNSQMYLVDGWDTPEWNMIWNKWLEGDVEKSLGQTRDFPLEDPGGVSLFKELDAKIIIQLKFYFPYFSIT